jgi:uncharacterized protein
MEKPQPPHRHYNEEERGALELFRYIDMLVAVTFVLVQFRSSQLMARAAGHRLAGTRLKLAFAGIGAFNVVLLGAYSLSLGAQTSHLHAWPVAATMLIAGCLLYTMLAAGVLLLHGFLQMLHKPLDTAVDTSRRRLLSAAGGAVLAAPFAVLGYGVLVERLDFHVREVDVPIPTLPPDLEGIRILQISDIHLSPFLSEKDLARVIDASNELRPHIAAITGDLITERGDPLDAAIRQLARLRADSGLYGCMGNHEQFARVQDYTERAAGRVGIRFLRRAAVPLRFGSATLNLAGLDYQSKAEKPRYLRGTERFLVPGALNVLLQHNPDTFPAAARAGYNLLLAGHTHGGQVTIEILDESISPARFFTPYVYGLYPSPDGRPGIYAYVTRGIGTIAIPARVGAPPEIALLRLRKA